jgi:hypothetical protein
MSGYPKLVWLKDGREVTVRSDSDVLKLVADGVYAPPPESEPVPVAEVPADDVPVAEVPAEPPQAPQDAPDEEGPTFGPPHDQTHAKRGGKKK